MHLLDLILLQPGIWMALMVSLTALSVAIVRKALKRAQLFDHPNERSNHHKPIVRGGGLGVLIAVLPMAWLMGAPLPLLLVTGGLCLAFFLDDLHGLRATWRLALQASALLALFCIVPSLHPFTLLLPYVTHLESWMLVPVGFIVLLGGLWWLNLSNFMDGIDGLAACELACIAFGTILLSGALPAMPDHVALLGGVLLTASYGFLAWNWHPARIFLGDSGSVPLAVLSGYLLWQIAASGAWAAALLLPAYFLMDATATLVLRAARREKLTEAHSAHAYQRAVRGGLGHRQVVGRVVLLNALLIGLALLSMQNAPWTAGCLVLGYAASFLLWLRLGGGWHALRAAPLSTAPLRPAPLSRKEPA